MRAPASPLALEPGVIRLRGKGSAGGHNGLADIIEKLGTDEFARLRVGIGKSAFPDARDYVLGEPSKEEKELIALENNKDSEKKKVSAARKKEKPA